MNIQERQHDYLISFPYYPAVVASLKRAVPMAYWNKHAKCWIVSKSEGSTAAVKWWAEKRGVKITMAVPESNQNFVIPPLPKLELQLPMKLPAWGEFQNDGIAFGIQKKRLLIGDDMGLGKTYQAIGILLGCEMLDPGNVFPAVIICPSSLKENWRREWIKFSDKKPIILTDNIKNNWYNFYEAGLADVFITNYESLTKYFVAEENRPEGKPLKLEHFKFRDVINKIKSVVPDEFHRCKSYATRQSKLTMGIASGKKYVIGLTGTPVINKPADLVPQLSIIGVINTKKQISKFKDRYCNGPRQASNLKELNFRLSSSCFYRRTKDQVLKELPPRVRQRVYCDITTTKEYNDAEASLVAYLQQYKNATDEQIAKSLRGEIMVRIGILKNISARGKINDVTEFIHDTLDGGNKLVVFGHLSDVIGRLKENFPHAVTITGKDKMTATVNERQQSVDAFQNDPKTTLALVSINAGGVGLTLTASSRVAFIELGWHPAIHDQAESRCHRIGQTDSVQCTYFLGKGTIDEEHYALIDEKRAMANQIVGDETVVEEKVMNDLIEILTKRTK